MFTGLIYICSTREIDIRLATAVAPETLPFRFCANRKPVMSGNSLADSSAVSISGRVLPQHHTAVTLLGTMIAAQPEPPFDWLDLASGRGQIIAHLEDTLPDAALRGKIRYLGYDINNEYTRETEKLASQLKFSQSRVITGELGHFPKICPPDETFSFISFTNVVHELPPRSFRHIIARAHNQTQTNWTALHLRYGNLAGAGAGGYPVGCRRGSPVAYVYF
jgi:hypothetical protein